MEEGVKISALPEITEVDWSEMLPASTTGDSPVTGGITTGTLRDKLIAYIDSIQTGWIPVTEEWVYVSATSIKIEGIDVTAKYGIGTKLRLVQSTVKYFEVVGVTYSTDTTITIAKNKLYSLADAEISAPHISYSYAPQGYPNWYHLSIASAYQAVSQTSFPNDSFANVTLDTEVADVGGNFASNAYTAPISGWYAITASLGFKSLGGGNRMNVVITVNNTRVANSQHTAGSTNTHLDDVSKMLYLNEGDVVRLQGRQNTGSLAVQEGMEATYMTIALQKIA